MIIFLTSPGAEIIAGVLLWSEFLVSVYLALALFLGPSRGPKMLLVPARVIALLLCFFLVSQRFIPILGQLLTG